MQYCKLHYCLTFFVPPVASAPTNLMAVQEGLTSIRVSWSPPTPLGDTTGYRIYYSDSNSSDSMDVSGGSIDNYLLTGLQNGNIFNVSVVATSQHLTNFQLRKSEIIMCKNCGCLIYKKMYIYVKLSIFVLLKVLFFVIILTYTTPQYTSKFKNNIGIAKKSTGDKT